MFFILFTGRKIQEEKLAKVMEMEKQKAAGQVAMDTN